MLDSREVETGCDVTICALDYYFDVDDTFFP